MKAKPNPANAATPAGAGTDEPDRPEGSVRAPAQQPAALRWRRLRHTLWRARPSLTAFVFLLLSGVVLAVTCYEVDLFVADGAPTVENTIELDEMLLISTVLLIGMLAFSMQRYIAQRREMRRRLDAERHVRELAYQDPLTGLPNRRQFEEALELAAAAPPAAGSVHALLMLDLNGFKYVNDVYGHDAGDAVLMGVAQRLRATLRDAQLAARLGGDEFVLLARDLLGPEAASSIALRILQALAQPIVVDGIAHTIGTGIGIALLPADASSGEEAMRKADVALYRAKAERRPAWRFFEEDMDRMVRERKRLEDALKTALAEDRIVARFRPSYTLRTGRIAGFEALPHWVEAGGDGPPPERFLPIAAETGLIHALALRVAERAFDAARQWPVEVTLALNVLPGQLSDRNLPRTLLGALARAGLSPQRLQVDIAENMVVQQLQATRALVEPLQAAGVSVALDHFGTGYSNLYHMQQLRFDKVKIDRRLIEQLDGSGDAKLVRALVGLGHGLGVPVSADGLDACEDRRELLNSGVQEGQSGAIALSAEQAYVAVMAGPARLPH
ncbi:putative bifunctional diguanylate cyclase/phosphodiesterase [Chitinasiproducens palmae]|uniref:Diguanylate cyclase (GGDEF) domain-containing protein n=1 Tax=Chitinasiproducens palmae TaxID=1770053 RepID=A0A1H2PV55_9BURK|nr:EAL domain-containing protein [Chitinasiproducens palmae]SDV50716.1 diguanylate cyclase (GGDEF) domain-containing protein [Chitinasiproducens palmae]